MLKKTLIILLVLATLAVMALNALSRKAPELLRQSIGRALNKKVVIQSIEYRFPWLFELRGFEILEREPFQDERAFYVDQVRLEVSPLGLSRKRLIISKIEMENADITIRKYDGKLFHALSDTLKMPTPSPVSSADADGSLGDPGKRGMGPTPLPLDIHKFHLNKSHFRFIDYDVEKNGFVVVFDEIEAKIRGIQLPFSSERTYYSLNARLAQGRDQKAAEAKVYGWTQFADIDTDANITLNGVFLPYFRPYYGQVTAAAIEEGVVDARANITIENKDLTATVDLEMIGLLFQSYEEENQLFGLKADEILSFLKDRSGRLRFQVVVKWNLADRSVRTRDVIRKSIERSLKSTVLGNIGNILQKTIEKISEKGGFEQAKKDPDSVLNKIKSFFK